MLVKKLAVLFILVLGSCTFNPLNNDTSSNLSTTSVDTKSSLLTEERMTLHSLGTSFKQPKAWFNANEYQMMSHIGKLNSKKENIEQIIATHRSSLHIATFYKYNPAEYVGIIPTINILARHNPSRDFDTFFAASSKSSLSVGNIFNSYELQQLVTERMLAGKRIAYFSAEFDLNTGSSTKSHISNTTYLIPFQDTLIQVSMSEEKTDNPEPVFAEFIEAFEFTDNTFGF